VFLLAWIGGSELLVALLVALLLFGGRLPEVMKDFGRLYFRMRRSLEDLRRETGIDKTLRELEWEARDLARTMPKVDPPKLTPVPPDFLEEAEDAQIDDGEAEEPPAAGEEPPGEAERRP